MHTRFSKVPAYIPHLLGSILFISIPVFSSPDFYRSGHLFDIVPFQRNLLSYFLLLIFFYANYSYYIPRFFFARKKYLFAAAIIGSYLLIAILPLLLFPDGSHTFTGSIMPLTENSSVFNFILVLIFGLLLKSNERFIEIRNDKLKTEVSYLKSQINPHFLFNTLNSIYSLTLDKSDKAPDTVLKLSSMMRYVIAESSRDKVSLEKEIEYIRNYISLQQLRMDSSTQFTFSIMGSFAGKSIPPLLLIPFIENAFKFGLNTEKEAEITISIEVTDQDMMLTVTNKKVDPYIPINEKSGQGIENTRQRLQYLYPDKHKLLIFDTQDIFTVNLSINLS